MRKSKTLRKLNLEVVLMKLSEDASLAKRGLRDAGIWPKIEVLLKRARKLFHKGKTDECISVCQEILQTNPDHFMALLYSGFSYSFKNDYKKAIDFFSKCLNVNYLDNKSWVWWVLYERSNCYSKMGDYLLAFEDVKRLIELEPAIDTCWRIAAEYLFYAGKFNDAHYYIDRAINLSKDTSEPLLTKAKIYQNQGNLEEAHSYINRAIHLAPNSPEARIMKAEICENQGRLIEALDEYRLAEKRIKSKLSKLLYEEEILDKIIDLSKKI